MKVITESQCAGYFKTGHPETPERVSKTIEFLHGQPLSLEWGKPVEVSDSVILRAHKPELLARLEKPEDFDSDTPHFPGIAKIARTSVGGALAGLDCACRNEMSFSLMRPPGHHATPTHAMGFCYFNSIAIAALEAQTRGFKRIAIFDFDVHHGNGTEDILVDKPGFAFASVHASGYPHSGTQDRGTNCFNFMMHQDTPRDDYKAALAKALERLRQFKPDLLAVSAGFDAYREDPLSEQHLEVEDYHWLGNLVREFRIPTFSILEGGYSNAVPQLVYAYLCGLEGEAKS